MSIGHHLELAGKPILNGQIFVAEELQGIARANLQQVARDPLDLTAIAGDAECDSALALLSHGVIEIDEVAVADEVKRIGLREFLFRIV